MALQKSQVDNLLFVKGLITEAPNFGFPREASVDELNFDLDFKGFRRKRRYGIEYESGYGMYDTLFTLDEFGEIGMNTYEWLNVNGDATVAVGVIQLRNRLYFIDLRADVPSQNFLNSATKLEITESNGLSDYQFTEISGDLIIATGDSDPVRISYDADSDVMSYEIIDLKIRDTFGVADGLSVDEHPTTLSNSHKYNLMNQGWTSAGGDVIPGSGDVVSYFDSSGITYFFECIESHTASAVNEPVNGSGSWQTYWAVSSNATDRSHVWVSGTAYTDKGDYAAAHTDTVNSRYSTEYITEYFDEFDYYPSNADIWQLGKYIKVDKGYDKWSAAQLGMQNIGTTHAPKGRFIIDAFDRGADRYILDDATGSINPDHLDRDLGRPSTVATFANRVFYSGIRSDLIDPDGASPSYNGAIFFTQTINNCQCYAKCYQDADPTSETVSDLVATDGGVVFIANASYIYKLVPFGNNIIVFADNGVWSLRSSDKGFSATDYEIVQISRDGALGSKGIVYAGDSVYYLSKVGILQLTADAISGGIAVKDVTENTIKTYYNEIPEVAKQFACGFYDHLAKRITWLYNDDASYDGQTRTAKYNRLLHYDIRADAWIPWEVYMASGVPYISGVFRLPGYITSTENVDVWASGYDVIASSGDDVIITGTSYSQQGTTSIVYVTIYEQVATDTPWITLSTFTNTDFEDWASYDAAAYIYTGYDLGNSPAQPKQSPLVLFYMHRTETAVAGGTYTNPSACKYKVRWDGANTNSARWSRELNAYRLNPIHLPSGDADPLNYPYDVVITKDIIRGFGRALALYLYTVAGKDCQIYGWSTTLSANADPA